MNVIRVLLMLFLGENSMPEVILRALFIISLWKIFKKSGVKSWWALIPWAREYQLSRCAGREQEGRVWSVCSFGMTVLNLIVMCFSFKETDPEMLVIIRSASFPDCVSSTAPGSAGCGFGARRIRAGSRD